MANSTRLFADPWYLSEPRENRKFYSEFVYPTLSSHQRVLLVPGLFGNLSALNGVDPAAVAAQDERLALKMEEYWRWAQADALVFGLNPYHWGDDAIYTHKSPTTMCYTGISCNRPATCGKTVELRPGRPGRLSALSVSQSKSVF